MPGRELTEADIAEWPTPSQAVHILEQKRIASMSGPKSGMVSNDLVRGALFCGGFLLDVLVSRQKPDADLIAGESYQATAAICETCRRQKQEELF